MANNRPVVMTKDGVYIRDVGMVTRDLSSPGVLPPNQKTTNGPEKTRGEVPDPEDVELRSRFDCVRKAREK